MTSLLEKLRLAKQTPCPESHYAAKTFCGENIDYPDAIITVNSSGDLAKLLEAAQQDSDFIPISDDYIVATMYEEVMHATEAELQYGQRLIATRFCATVIKPDNEVLLTLAPATYINKDISGLSAAEVLEKEIKIRLAPSPNDASKISEYDRCDIERLVNEFCT